MSKEQDIVERLLKSRYKLMADYPANGDKIGFIYEGNNWSKRWIDIMDRMPHLFKKLAWWEERKESEMPQYVKWLTGSVRPINEVLKRLPDKNKLDHWLPATETEYNNQQRQVKE